MRQAFVFRGEVALSVLAELGLERLVALCLRLRGVGGERPIAEVVDRGTPGMFGGKLLANASMFDMVPSSDSSGSS